MNNLPIFVTGATFSKEEADVVVATFAVKSENLRMYQSYRAMGVEGRLHQFRRLQRYERGLVAGGCTLDLSEVLLEFKSIFEERRLFTAPELGTLRSVFLGIACIQQHYELKKGISPELLAIVMKKKRGKNPVSLLAPKHYR